jgi:hypothetical protein
MPADDVYLALVRLQDPAVRASSRGGDWSGLGALDLDDHERDLVQGLIDESVDAEVEGFAGGARFAVVQYTSGQVSEKVLRTYPPQEHGLGSGRWGSMSCGVGNCSQH